MTAVTSSRQTLDGPHCSSSTHGGLHPWKRASVASKFRCTDQSRAWPSVARAPRLLERCPFFILKADLERFQTRDLLGVPSPYARTAAISEQIIFRVRWLRRSMRSTPSRV